MNVKRVFNCSSRRVAVGAMLWVLAGLTSHAAAQERTSTEDTFNGPGIRNDRDYLGGLPFETIDPLSGSVVLSFTEFVLPGNGGSSLTFVRTYSSAGGGTWSAGIAGIPSGVGDVADVWSYPEPASKAPYFFMADGSERRGAFRDPLTFTNHDSDRWVVTTDHWLYDRLERRLYLPNGTTCLYGPLSSPLGGQSRLLEIRDRFGNLTTLTHTSTATTVTQHLEAGRQREVTLMRLPNSGVGQMIYADKGWTQVYENGNLVKLKPPTGPAWQFGYDGHSVVSVTTPNGGKVQYSFDTYSWNIAGPPGDNVQLDFYPVGTRTVTDRGGATLGSWSYVYTLVGPGNFGKTEVAGPGGLKVTFTHERVDASQYDEKWMLTARKLEQCTAQCTTMETESREYIATSSGILTGPHPFPPFAVLKKATIVRDGDRAYETEYGYRTGDGRFGDFHHPSTITERSRVLSTGAIERERTTTVTYDYDVTPYLLGLAEQVTTLVGAETHTTTNVRDNATGFILSRSVDGVLTEFTSDPYGNVEKTKNARAYETSYQYEWGAIKSMTTPEITTLRVINTDGTIASETQGRLTTEYMYDALSRVTQATFKPVDTRNGVSTQYDDESGEFVKTTTGLSVSTAYLDGFGRTIAKRTRVVSGSTTEDIATRTNYDAFGRVSYQSLPYFSAISESIPAAPTPSIGARTTYDALGRSTSVTNGDGSALTSTYSGDTVVIRDEEGHATTQTWEAFGRPDDRRLASVTDAAGQTWRYEYNALGSVSKVIFPGSTSTSPLRAWGYDSHGWPQSESMPESGTTTFGYDEVGNMNLKIDAKGTTFVYEYDGNDRPKKVTASASGSAPVETTIEYEPQSDRRELVSVKNVGDAGPRIRSWFSYDAAGRLRERTDTIRGHVVGTSYRYDLNDNLKSVTYPSGRTLTYTYDTGDRLTSVTESKPAGVVSYASNMRYHPSGSLTTYTAGNGVVQNITYHDTRYWPTHIGAGALSLDYAYDGVGNIREMRDSRYISTQPFKFLYDQLDRLTSNTGPHGGGAYDYDAHGNRITIPGGASSYTYDQPTLRLSSQDSVAFTYDNNGNTLSHGTEQYRYTPSNMLSSVWAAGSSQPTAVYEYDGDDLRKVRTTGGETHFYVHGLGTQLLSELKDRGANAAPEILRDYIYAGGRLLATIKPPAGTVSTSGRVRLIKPAPSTGYAAGDTLEFEAEIGVGLGAITKVQFLNGNVVFRELTQSPWTTVYENVAAGTYTFKARAWTGPTAFVDSDPVIINVKGLGRPTGVFVDVTEVPQGQEAIITVIGVNPCGAVQLNYGDETNYVDAIEGLPIVRTHVWNTQGTKTITITGHGNCRGVVSTNITVTPPNNPPAVALTGPANGATFPNPGTIALTAEASDSDGTISRVEFYNGSVLLGTATASPYTFTWANVEPGTYSLSARALDNRAGKATTAPVQVRVMNLGTITVTPMPLKQGQMATVTVNGAGLCGAVGMNFGDGTGAFVDPITGLPWSWTHAFAVGGQITITAVGHGNCFGTLTKTITVTPNALPVVNLTSPAPGSAFIVGAPVTLAATATDSDGTVARVEFYDGATLLGTATNSPYSYTWNVPVGTHSVSAKAIDDLNGVGASATAMITASHLSGVTVSPASVTTGQTATVTVTGASTCGSVNIDYNDGQQSETYANGTLPVSKTRVWSTAGVKTITVTGQGDCVGQVSTTLTVTGNQLPTVSIGSPANGASFVAGAAIPLTASAADSDGTIARVEYYDGASLIGSATTSPFSVSWTNAAVGAHTITAKAIDNFNGVGTSAAITVTVTHLTAVTVSPSPIVVGQTGTVTVTGASTCGSVNIDYGDGTNVTYANGSLPTSQAHVWITTGAKTITATGQGNCVGTASTTVTVNANAAPTVALTSPTNGAVFVAPAAIPLSASASDSDGTVARVEYYDGATLIGSATTSPYSVSWTNAAAGAHTITAKAIDNFNAPGTSAARTVTVTHVGAVSVSPSPIIAGATGTVTVTGASTCGSVNINYGDGTNVTYANGSLPTSQVHVWASAGAKTITATGQGNCIGTASTTLTVNANALPAVTLTSPANGATYNAPATIPLSAAASDSDGTIARVEYYNGGTLIGTAYASPYSASWANVAAGTYYVRAKAIDNLGGSTLSNPAFVTVNALPAVTLTSPANGATYNAPATIPLSAAASDSDGTIARVEYYNGGTLIGTAYASPYSASWANVPAGSYYIRAKAIDNLSGSTLSDPAFVTINAIGQLSAVSVSGGLTQGGTSTVTVTGGNPCGAVTINYGDGTAITYAITGLPTSQTHTWATGGTKTITATGQGNCAGSVSTSAYVNWKPTVSISAPIAGSTFVAPASITISASASDPEGTMSRVDFYANGTYLGSDYSAPYSIQWNNVGAAGYTLTAYAVDTAGLPSDASTVGITVNNAAASMVTSLVLSPSPAGVNQGVTATVYGTNPCGAVQINWGDGNTVVYPITQLPYSQTHAWTSAGGKTVTATGMGNCAGQVSTAITIQ